MFGERHIEQLILAIWGLTKAIEGHNLNSDEKELLNHLAKRARVIQRRIAVVAKAAQQLDAATTENER